MVGQVMHNISTWRWIRSSNGWTSSAPSCIGSISPCHVAEIATWQRHRSPGHAPRDRRCQWCKGKSWQERYKHHKFRNYINHNNSFLVQMLWVISRSLRCSIVIFFGRGSISISSALLLAHHPLIVQRFGDLPSLGGKPYHQQLESKSVPLLHPAAVWLEWVKESTAAWWWIFWVTFCWVLLFGITKKHRVVA